MDVRQSHLALVVIHLNVEGLPHLLFHRHPKWGDWSLIGGHVESDEETNWHVAAQREADEELAPLRLGEDFAVETKWNGELKWGPVPSRAKNNVPTIYVARYYLLRFLVDPSEALARLNPHDFALVRAPDGSWPFGNLVSDTFERFAATLHHRFEDVPLSWSRLLTWRQLEGKVQRHLMPMPSPISRAAV